jgi:peptide/nickel transport system permease protein
MRSYITRRILLLIPVLVGVTLCVFLIMHIIPGDVVSSMLGVESNPQIKAELNKQFGLNLPWYHQYWNWVSGVVTGDFGVSLRTGRAILPDIFSKFKVTFELTILASVFAWIIAIPLGIISALKRNTFVDFIVRIISLLGVSVPHFALATMLILFLSVTFSYYPPIGYVGFFDNPIRNLQILLLPALILGSGMAGSIMRLTRSSILEVLGQDFIRTIRAKGGSERLVIYKHALKNSLIPIVTIIGMQIGFLLGGAVIIEQIFSLPGLGQYTLSAILQRDYTVVQSSVLFISFVFVMINLLVDILYTFIDPRISYN